MANSEPDIGRSHALELLAQPRAAFLGELPERADVMESLILRLEQQAERIHTFDELYRWVHSLKGGAGTHGSPHHVGVPPLSRTTSASVCANYSALCPDTVTASRLPDATQILPVELAQLSLHIHRAGATSQAPASVSEFEQARPAKAQTHAVGQASGGLGGNRQWMLEQ